VDPFFSVNAANRRLGAAAQQEDDKKNRNRNTQQPKQNLPMAPASLIFAANFIVPSGL
jgi:hypothetical protein